MIPIIVSLSCGDDDQTNPELGTEINGQILSLVNDHRKSIGLESLQSETNSDKLALEHSQNMANGKEDFGHGGFDSRAELLFDATGASSIGENVAFGQAGANEVMQSWLDSPGHRANIEGDYTHIGIGVADDASGVPYYTQIFLKID